MYIYGILIIDTCSDKPTFFSVKSQSVWKFIFVSLLLWVW